MPLTSSVWNNFKVSQGTTEPGAFRIGDGGGAAVITGTISAANLDTILTEGVETATANNDTGQINRILPVAHPRRPWLFLKNVDNAQGISFVEKVEADPEGTLEAPAMPFWADYTEYRIQATFEPRGYALIADEGIPSQTLSYYLDDDDGIVAATTKTIYPEWWRYVEWVSSAAADYITADIGQYTFVNPGGLGDPTTGPETGSGASKGQIRQLMPSMTWRVLWSKVPYQYLLSDKSYITRLIGKVNQNTWGGFQPGQALLEAVNTIRVYTPPFPSFTDYAGRDVVAQNKLCDLEFLILDALDRTTPTVVTPANRSHIASGHNVVPYRATNRFYYCEQKLLTGGAAGTGQPLYPSGPFELLFQNPDKV